MRISKLITVSVFTWQVGKPFIVYPSAHWSHLSPVTLGLQVHFPLSAHCVDSEPSALHSHAKNLQLQHRFNYKNITILPSQVGNP